MLWLAAVLEAWRPGSWLFLAPACLPFLNFSPWTGWLIFEEFDILLLGLLAGGYIRIAICADSRTSSLGWHRYWDLTTGLVVLLAISGLWALQRGLADAGGFTWDWFAGYPDPMNSVRVFKSLFFGVMFYPLLRRQLEIASEQAAKHVCLGMVTGLSVLVLAVVWERLGFAGLLNFSAKYRTVGLFWEMHVGGAAIDSYLAMATPFAAWALLTARRPFAWLAAAVLVTLTVYACLTTFSRGVYLATLGSTLVLPWLVKRNLPAGVGMLVPGWRANGIKVLLALLVVEVIGVIAGSSFMGERIQATGRDMNGRLAHWQHGLDLLDKRPNQLLGLGLGRLPASYSATVPQQGFSGDIKWKNEIVTLRTPGNLDEIGGVWGLTQRVSLQHPGPYRLKMNVGTDVDVKVKARICERHLLYDRICQGANLSIASRAGAWQEVDVALLGPPMPAGPWYSQRFKMLALSVSSAGSTVDLDNVTLTDVMGKQLLLNGDFSQNLAGWFPAAQYHFVPWHIDNLYLETLIERGLLGLLAFGLVVVAAFWRYARRRTPLSRPSPYILSAMVGALLVGLVSSVLDVPRVAFLFYLLIFIAATPIPHPANNNP